MLVLRFLLLMFVSAAAFAADITGRWDGVIAPGQLNLEFIVVFAEQPHEGLLSIPAQGMLNHNIGIPEISGTTVEFTIPGIPGNPRFVGEQDGENIEGVFSQSGSEFSFHMTRTDASETSGPNRPQHPEGPFPYTETEVTALNGNIALAGTITVPTDGASTGVLLINGSGPQNRNSEIYGHEPFLVLADHLARAGFAVARFDDRGIGGSDGEDAQATYEDLTADALAQLDALTEHAGVQRVVVIGHSQGGYLAPVVAQQNSAVVGVVLLAGPAVNGAEVLVRQNELFIEADAGAAPPAVVQGAIDQQLRFLHPLIDYVIAEKYDEANAHIENHVRNSLAQLPPASVPSEEVIAEIIEAQQAGIVSPVMRSFLQFDPAPYLSALQVPVLAVYGELDLQVEAAQSTDVLASLLDEAGNNDVTITVFEHINHLLQPAVTGKIDEYPLIPITIDEDVLKAVTNWLAERF